MIKPQILALRDIAVTLVAAIIGGLAINYAASEFTSAEIITGFATFALIYAIYMLYTIRVNQYKYQQKLNEMVDELHK
jgi:hydrogenase maturation factor